VAAGLAVGGGAVRWRGHRLGRECLTGGARVVDLSRTAEEGEEEEAREEEGARQRWWPSHEEGA
jgi:hypothetical protein